MRLASHNTSPARPSRFGFTLVELMVVLAIIGVIITLVASASMQVITRRHRPIRKRRFRKYTPCSTPTGKRWCSRPRPSRFRPIFFTATAAPCKA